MRRVVVLIAVFSMGHASLAFAGDTLLASGKQAVQRIVAETKASAPKTSLAPAALAAAEQGGQRGAENITLAKSKRLWLAIGIGVAFAGIAYAIDQKVEDGTPSSAGNRPKGPFDVPRLPDK